MLGIPSSPDILEINMSINDYLADETCRALPKEFLQANLPENAAFANITKTQKIEELVRAYCTTVQLACTLETYHNKYTHAEWISNIDQMIQVTNDVYGAFVEVASNRDPTVDGFFSEVFDWDLSGLRKASSLSIMIDYSREITDQRRDTDEDLYVYYVRYCDLQCAVRWLELDIILRATKYTEPINLFPLIPKKVSTHNEGRATPRPPFS